MSNNIENNRIGDTKRVTYAKRFYSYFKLMFTELKNGTQTFEITRLQFAEFLFKNGWLPENWEEIPTPHDRSRWAFMRNLMNKIRTEMNAAAHIGLHGEPPFEARAVKGHSGNIVVHNLAALAMVTHTGVGNALKIYIKNKVSDHQRRYEFLMQPENLSRLPEGIRSSLMGLEGQFNIVTTTATSMLSQYLKASNDAQQSAHEFLKLEDNS